LFLYRLLGMALVLFDVFLLARLVARLTGSARLGLLAAALAPLTFQFRLHHDPILRYCFLLPMAFTFLAGSLLSLALHLATGQRRCPLLSLAGCARAVLA